MRLVDTHCHLDMDKYDGERARVLNEARDAGVRRIIVPGTSVDSTIKARDLAGKHEMVYFAAGIHPHEADRYTLKDFKFLKQLATESEKLIAIGEVGLDHYRGYADKENQRKLFKDMCRLALETDLPLIIHSRKAFKDVMNVLDEVFGSSPVRGQMHCFDEDEKEAAEVIKRGLYVSFAPNITYPGSKSARKVLRELPPERLLLETDGPYLAPVEKRGKRNDPANVTSLLKICAEASALTEEDIARITTHNANALFSLGLEERSRSAYRIRSSVYLNITNRCSNRCGFCTRHVSSYVKGHRLDVLREPTLSDIFEDMQDAGPADEIVFCGFGEPLMRFGLLKEIASRIKKEDSTKPIRLVTNGQGDLILGRKVIPELRGLIDKVSVSVNAADPETYGKLTDPVFQGNVFEAVLGFARSAADAGMDVELTALDIVGDEQLKDIESIAADIGGRLRVRRHNEVG